MTTPDPEQNARLVLARHTLGKDNVQAVEGGGSCYHSTDTAIAAMLEYAALTTPTPRQEEAVAVPAGMVPWLGGDRAPDDWDGGPVAWSDGGTGTPTFLAWCHDEENWPYVIAYTSRATPNTAPLSGEDDRNCTEAAGSERSRSGVTDFAAAPLSGEDAPAIEYHLILKAMREAMESHPFWRKVKHTPAENDLPVRAANVAMRLIGEL